MRTKDAVTPSLTGSDVLMSLTVYVIAYIVIFGAGGYFMGRFLRAGPTDERPAAQRRSGIPARPLSAAEVD
jgi:cytochrome d ubiquinol oxidase subunit I